MFSYFRYTHTHIYIQNYVIAQKYHRQYYEIIWKSSQGRTSEILISVSLAVMTSKMTSVGGREETHHLPPRYVCESLLDYMNILSAKRLQWIYSLYKATVITWMLSTWLCMCLGVQGSKRFGCVFCFECVLSLVCDCFHLSCLPCSLLWSFVGLGPSQTLWRTPKGTHSKKTGLPTSPEKSSG